jgi:hypothetical protein
MEDEDIVIHGETPLDDDERDEGEIPVRLLEEFVVYDMNSLEAVPLASLLKVPHSKCVLSASGLVKPWIEEDSEDEDDSEDSENEDDRSRMSVDPQWDRFSLSQIREFSVHSPSGRNGKLDVYVAPVCPTHYPDQWSHQEIIYQDRFCLVYTRPSLSSLYPPLPAILAPTPDSSSVGYCIDGPALDVPSI